MSPTRPVRCCATWRSGCRRTCAATSTVPSCSLPWTRSRVTDGPRESAGMLKEFREFILRGNVVDLAIAVVIGAAFGAVVAALVADLVTPLIAAIGGQPNFGGLTFKIN